MNVIAIESLNKTYRGKRGATVQALTNLNLDIEQGDVFGFLGPNGAGKSTTIKILTGQIRATSGAATLFGVPVSAASARRRIGYLPENPSFFQFMTGREYLAFAGRVHGMAVGEIDRASTQVLELLELAAAANRPIRGYSKGMVQRLGLAQAMLHDPDLYIFDEPMSGLDPIGRALVKRIIGDLGAEGKTVFFSTHITTDVEEVCNRVGMLVKGELKVVDRVEHILQKSFLDYRVSLIHPEHGIQVREIPRRELEKFLLDLSGNGCSVERIEPLRENLETCFLKVVRGEHA